MFFLYTSKHIILTIPESPPTSIFLRFFASRTTIVNFPEFGTYRKEKHMSPNCNLRKIFIRKIGRQTML